MLEEFENDDEKIFVLRGLIEIRIPRHIYEKLSRKHSREHIISFTDSKRVLNRITGRELVFVTKESGIPLLGHSAFGIIDRGTNLLQVRCITGCNLNCIFCSVDEGRMSKTRKTDYIVDPDYMAEEVEKVAKFKGGYIEIHLDGQGEPLLYPYMEELVKKLSALKEVSVISMQTNGILLNEEKISALEKYVTRVNLSLSSLDEEIARKLHGSYPLKKVIENAEMIANSRMDLLIAPVWVPGYNDEEIPKIIEFALEIGAGKRYPPLGIQKYIPYKFGRNVRKRMSFKEFYEKLAEFEKEYGVKLALKPEDFGMERRRRIESPFRKGDISRARIVAEGRLHGEKLCVARNRSVAVMTDKKIGEVVKFKVTSSKDGIIVAQSIKR
ncbi:radical SAM protein [Methermicoccus shengliensis]|uniref:radical SAM protein n=1 Tax=Methermicoccus shengliensis TaxID=660064 RepID=UPI0005B2A976|nr:radical SAM protein [Methermicoccus shengliensis]